MAKPRVLMAEDHLMVYQGISTMLARDYEFLGQVASGAKVHDAILAHKPHLLILDLDLPERHGTELLPEVRARHPRLPVLVLTVQNSPEVMEEVIRLGATGFVPKGAGVTELRAAIKDCLAGTIHRSPKILKLKGEDPTHPHDRIIAGLEPLRKKIFELIGQGRDALEVAQLIGLSRWSVYYHRKLLRRALHVSSEKALDRAAMEWTRRRLESKAAPYVDPEPPSTP